MKADTIMLVAANLPVVLNQYEKYSPRMWGVILSLVVLMGIMEYAA